MPASALQPPAPGQYFGSRPSFSYNVVSHANARLPTGQQFQLDTVISHGFIIITIVLYTFFNLKLVT
jgi:transcription elongation regulator 1